MLNLPLPKQYYLGNLPGRIVFLYGNASTVLGMMGFIFGASSWFMLATNYFNIHPPIWLFYIFLFVSLVAIMFLYYMLVIPSVISFSNEQACKHQNPIYQDLDLIKYKLGITEADIKAWKESKEKNGKG